MPGLVGYDRGGVVLIDDPDEIKEPPAGAR